MKKDTTIYHTQTARQGLGRTGERLAAEALMSKGYHILERNFRCRQGEIDLVAEDEQDLIFVEVKARRGVSFGLPEDAITSHKRRKLVEVASYYLDLHTCSERSWRIDVVAVQFSSSQLPHSRSEGLALFSRERQGFGAD